MKLSLQPMGLLILLAVSPNVAAEVRVIANPSMTVSQISIADLKSVFLATKTSLADGSRVEPVLLKPGKAFDDFAKQYTGKTSTGLENYYRSLVFTGKGRMPKMFKSDAEVLEYVRKTRGAIGYVSAEADIEGVKLLNVK